MAVAQPSTGERVLDAALASFAQRGYEATSLDALAAGLGVRKQTILYYHPSKDALLEAVVERAATDLGQVLVAGAGRPEAVVDAVLRLGAARPELLALVREVVRLGPPVSTGLLARLEPLIASAGARLGRERILATAAMVVGLATEVEVLRAAGTEPDLAWLRRRRTALLAELTG